MSNSNEQLFRNVYEGVSNGDVPGLLAVLAENIEWTVNGPSPLAGRYAGRNAVAGFFGKMMELYDGGIDATVHDVLANDRRVVVLTTERGTHRGKTIESSSVHVWTIEDGIAQRFESFEDDRYYAFWQSVNAG